MTPSQKNDADELPPRLPSGFARANEIAQALDAAHKQGIAEGERLATARIVAALHERATNVSSIPEIAALVDAADDLEAGRL